MCYSWSNAEFGYIAAAFRAAALATVTPTATPTFTPTVTPTVPPAPSGQIWRSYYREASPKRSEGDFAGAQRVAMRVQGDPLPANNGVFYLLGDHLDSTSIVVDPSGTLVSELRYKAWGETRYSSGAAATDYRYTRQREEPGLGLYYYRARWYDPGLGRFAQADLPIDNPGNPQAFDRYGYVLNNPLGYVDPSGRDRDCSPWDSACKEQVRKETRCGPGPYGSFGVKCDLSDFAGMAMEERREWLRGFAEKIRSDWFNNIGGILDFFVETEGTSLPSTADWTTTVDAFLLLSIQQGYALAVGVILEGDPGVLPTATSWESFFMSAASGETVDVLRAQWSAAETAATRYAVHQAQGIGVEPSSWDLFFLRAGDVYRWRVGITIFPAGPLRFPFGDWASDPRSSFAGRSPAYCYSMLFWRIYTNTSP